MDDNLFSKIVPLSLIAVFFVSSLSISSKILFALENPTTICVPSQKGLFLDSPHRHNAMPTVVDSGYPLNLEDCKLPSDLDRLSSSLAIS